MRWKSFTGAELYVMFKVCSVWDLHFQVTSSGFSSVATLGVSLCVRSSQSVLSFDLFSLLLSALILHSHLKGLHEKFGDAWSSLVMKISWYHVSDGYAAAPRLKTSRSCMGNEHWLVAGVFSTCFLSWV